MASDDEITDLLAAIRVGNAVAESQLLNLVYSELRRLARSHLAGERKDHTLQPTALVHEAYVRMLRLGKVAYQDRVHFFSVAANAMRRVLIDHARRRNSAKRPNKDRVDFDSLLAGAAPKFDQWLVLDQALTRLADWDARQARIVELLYFGGLTEREAAAAVGISERTVKRDWATARAWLQAQLAGSRT